jgi:hypothetical protein
VLERFEWLFTAVNAIDGEAMVIGAEEGLRRLGYVTYFGHCIQMVPAAIPHTNGKLWKEAFLNPLMPRIFFPDKGVFNDSDRTNAYSGIFIPGAERGVSISIGYMGESYIDFGPWGMFVPIFLWGWLVGWCFDFIRRKAPHPLMGSALASCLVMSTSMLLESSNLKMVGGLIAAFLVTAVLMHFLGKPAWRWLTFAPPGNQRRNSRILPGKAPNVPA